MYEIQSCQPFLLGPHYRALPNFLHDTGEFPRSKQHPSCLALSILLASSPLWQSWYLWSPLTLSECKPLQFHSECTRLRLECNIHLFLACHQLACYQVPMDGSLSLNASYCLLVMTKAHLVLEMLLLVTMGRLLTSLLCHLIGQ